MGKRLAALLLLVTAAMGPAAAAWAGGRAPAAPVAPAPSLAEGDGCRKLSPGKRLKLNLKPNTELVDLVSWISSITCKQFIVPGGIAAQSRTVTIVSPQPITVAEAYKLFLDALDSVGFTIYASGKVLRLIETSKVKSVAIPIYIDKDGQAD
jgi:type II secretory pathway component GspD/PulD (secretin)